MSAACVVVVEVGGEEKGDELRNLSWRKGRWREKVNRRQLCQLGEHENFGGGVFEQSNVWSVGSDRESSRSNQTFISLLWLHSSLWC